jgi:hypothetical protein
MGDLFDQDTNDTNKENTNETPEKDITQEQVIKDTMPAPDAVRKEISKIQAALANPITPDKMKAGLQKRLDDYKEKYPSEFVEKKTEGISEPSDNEQTGTIREEAHKYQMENSSLNSPNSEQNSEQPEPIVIQVAEEEKDALVKFSDQEKKVQEIVALCKSVVVTDDASNTLARSIGVQAKAVISAIEKKRKELVRPHIDKQDAYNSVAKKLSSPIEEAVNTRINRMVTAYELAREEKRKAALAQAEKEKKEKEEAEAIEKARVDRIRASIKEVLDKGNGRIDKIDSSGSLDAFVKELSAWKPKVEFYGEFYSELENTIVELKTRAENRRPIIIQLEQNKAEAAKLEGEAKLQAEKIAAQQADKLKAIQEKEAAELATKKAEEEAKEANAKRELTILIAPICQNIHEELKRQIGLHGSAVNAMANKGKVIQSVTEAKTEKQEIRGLKSEKMKNQRLEFKFEIINEFQIPREFLSVDETKIRAAIVANRAALEKDINGFKIEGVTIYPDTKTVFKS